jgi:hypothetical protein
VERRQHQGRDPSREGAAQAPREQEGSEHPRRVRDRHRDAEEVEVTGPQRFESREQGADAKQRQEQADGLECGGKGLAAAPRAERREQALADGEVAGRIPEEDGLRVGAEEVVLDGEGGAEERGDESRVRAGHCDGSGARTRRVGTSGTATPP